METGIFFLICGHHGDKQEEHTKEENESDEEFM